MDSDNIKKRGIGEMIFAMFLMGTVGFFVLESGQSAYNIVFYRCLFGAIFLAIYCHYFGFFKETNLTKKNFIIIFFSAIFLIYNWILLFSSFKLASIATSTIVYHIQPFFFVIIWSLISKEKVSKEKLFWMGLAFLGLVLVIDIHYQDIRLNLAYITGLSFAVIAALLWALSAVLVKKTTAVKPHLIVLIQLIVGVVILSPFIDLTDVAHINGKQWVYLLILGTIHSGLTYILMYSAYQKLQTLIIAVLTFIYPAIAIMVDFIFYEKTLSLLQYLGVILIMLSGFSVNQNIRFSFLKRKTIP